MKIQQLILSSFLYTNSLPASTVAFTPSSSYIQPTTAAYHRNLPILQQQQYDDLDSMTVVQLKDELKKLDLKVSGKKSELIQRLSDFTNEQVAEEEEESAEAETEEDDEDEVAASPKVQIVKEEDKSFSELNLINSLQSSISLQEWEEPTPIQKLAIPSILEHFSDSIDSKKSCTSLWAEAPTGSGKTGAFALPLIQLTLEEKKKERDNAFLSRRTSSNANRQQRHLGGAGRRDKNSNNSNNDSGAVTSLILCPTRELAYQIGGVVEELIEAMTTNSKSNRDSLNVAVITGGVPMEPQIDLLASKKLSNEKVDILIATPGRLADVLQRSNKEEDTSEKELEKKLLAALDGISGKDASLTLAQLNDLKINESIANGDDGGRSALFDMLSSVKYLVLDEADRLLSPGFKTEMDGILDLLPRPPSSKRKRKDDNDIYGESSNDSDAAKVSDSQMKTLLFSATFPEQIEPRVEKVLRRLSGYNAPPPVRLSCALAGQTDEDDHEASMRQRKRMERTTQPQAIWEGPASTIDLRTIRLDERDRTPALRRLIGEYGEEWDRVLVFVATRYASEHVAMKLRKYHIRAAEIHGKLDQDARSRRLEDFRKGKTRVLIATDLASRGLDVVGLPAVVNYDLPRSTADFTHRIGRTGRAGNKGIAVSFITPANENQYNLIEKRHLKSNMVVEREILKGFEPNEAKWKVTSGAATVEVEGVAHSQAGLAHDKMFGGIKGRRKSKKDKAREKAARKEAARNN